MKLCEYCGILFKGMASSRPCKGYYKKSKESYKEQETYYYDCKYDAPVFFLKFLNVNDICLTFLRNFSMPSFKNLILRCYISLH